MVRLEEANAAGCVPVGATGAYDCPGGAAVDSIDMFGICLSGDIGAYFGLSGSVWFAFDKEGFGLIETLGSHEGLTYGVFGGGGIILSNGDMEDQKDYFDYVTGAAGYVYSASGTYSYGQSSMTGEDVWSFELVVGPGTGVSLVGGTSKTYVQRLEYSQIARSFGG